MGGINIKGTSKWYLPSEQYLQRPLVTLGKLHSQQVVNASTCMSLLQAGELADTSLLSVHCITWMWPMACMDYFAVVCGMPGNAYGHFYQGKTCKQTGQPTNKDI